MTNSDLCRPASLVTFHYPGYLNAVDVRACQMSVLGKFKAAVLGNPVTREYEIGRHVASGGPSCMWKIFDGVKKSSRHVR